MNFLNHMKQESNLTYTENGALTHASSGSECLDLFFRAGGMRGASEQEIADVVIRAFAADPAKAMKILFFIRDARGGLGERRFFRVAMQKLTMLDAAAVRRNIGVFAEYGRFDDLCAMLGTPCEADALEIIREQLTADWLGMENGQPVSLLAKWLPSVNASAAETCAAGKRVAKALGMSEKQYRHTLAALRKYTDIIENRLRERDYTFDYAKQASRAMFKYRKAFIRNDGERYQAYLGAVERGEAILHADALYPYDIIRACGGNDRTAWTAFRDISGLTAEERRSLDAAWKNLPEFGARSENAIAVVDGSGSMYINGSSPRPIDAALSLGIYFAEHNKGAFANHFITFSRTPRLVEIKGRDIAEKVQFCATFNEACNTNLEAVFDLILRTAVQNRIPQSEMPARLYIISDMEFDCVSGGSNQTLFVAMRQNYAAYGYRLPEIVFWNVASRHQNIPVSRSETGAALVSGASPAIFDMVIGGEISPEIVMEQIIGSERYAKIS